MRVLPRPFIANVAEKRKVSSSYFGDHAPVRAPGKATAARVPRSSGGDEENRTLNPRLAKAVLCQLSYVPVGSFLINFLAQISQLAYGGLLETVRLGDDRQPLSSARAD